MPLPPCSPPSVGTMSTLPDHRLYVHLEFDKDARHDPILQQRSFDEQRSPTKTFIWRREHDIARQLHRDNEGLVAELGNTQREASEANLELERLRRSSSESAYARNLADARQQQELEKSRKEVNRQRSEFERERANLKREQAGNDAAHDHHLLLLRSELRDAQMRADNAEAEVHRVSVDQPPGDGQSSMLSLLLTGVGASAAFGATHKKVRKQVTTADDFKAEMKAESIRREHMLKRRQKQCLKMRRSLEDKRWAAQHALNCREKSKDELVEDLQKAWDAVKRWKDKAEAAEKEVHEAQKQMKAGQAAAAWRSAATKAQTAAAKAQAEEASAEAEAANQERDGAQKQMKLGKVTAAWRIAAAKAQVDDEQLAKLAEQAEQEVL